MYALLEPNTPVAVPSDCVSLLLPDIEGYFRKLFFRLFQWESKQSAVSVRSSVEPQLEAAQRLMLPGLDI